MRFFLTGFMASGKSYWAQQWSKASGLRMFDLDKEIEKRTGQTVAEIFREKGEQYFRKLERDTLRTYLRIDDYIMACGGGTPCYFDNMQRMNEKGITIYLKAGVQEISQRLKLEKESRPLVKEVNDEVLEQFIEDKLKEREACYMKAIFHLPTRYLTIDNFEKIRKRYAR